MSSRAEPPSSAEKKKRDALRARGDRAGRRNSKRSNSILDRSVLGGSVLGGSTLGASACSVRSIKVTRHGSLKDIAAAAAPDAAPARPARLADKRQDSWVYSSTKGAGLTIVETEAAEGEAALAVEALVDVCVDPSKRAAAGLQPLGRGAYAQVVCFTAATPVKVEGGEVAARDLAIKIGTWPSEAAFVREGDCQRAAAEAGVAPRVYASSWRGGKGVLVMARLTCPTYYTWLTWLSKDLLRSPEGPKDNDEGWLVHPRVHKLPLVKAWATAHKSLRDRLAAANIRHGDVHDANIVFHVPAAAAALFSDGDADLKAFKRIFMRVIARGPGGGAELMIVDFGQAKKLDAAGKLCLSLCGDDHRFVDPDDDDRVSVTTEPDKVPEDLAPFFHLDKHANQGGVDMHSIAAAVNPTFGDIFAPKA